MRLVQRLTTERRFGLTKQVVSICVIVLKLKREELTNAI
jgi:hypothetical protein